MASATSCMESDRNRQFIRKESTSVQGRAPERARSELSSHHDPYEPFPQCPPSLVYLRLSLIEFCPSHVALVGKVFRPSSSWLLSYAIDLTSLSTLLPHQDPL